jgi:glycosyltransferase involved in cell wall biosynthesis
VDRLSPKPSGLKNTVKAASIIEPSGYIPLTLAVPTYNRCSSVQLLVKAIQAQAREQDEIILSDDGSTDETFEEASKIPGIRLVRHKENQGMVRNWNYCLDQARCEWICIIHDDDTLAPEGLEALRRACEFADQPALVLPTERQTECDESFRYRFWLPGAWSVLHCPTIPSGAVIHRKIVQELGGFNPKFCYSADLEYFPRIAAHFPVVIIDSPVAVRYELHDSNYQMKTWRKADFYSQLEEIQRLIITYAGRKGPTGESLVQQRLTSLLEYIIREAHRRGDQILVRQYAQLAVRRIQTGGWTHFLNLLRSLKQAFREYYLNKD